MIDSLRTVCARIREQPASRVIGLGVFLAVAAVLIYRNAWMFHTVILEDGDFASNSILIDKSLGGEWFLGHYSRFGFYHPGPFFLYLQGLGELLFFDLFHITPSPYNSHFLAALIFNSALIGVCTALVASRLKTALVALWVPGVLLALSILQPPGLASTWAPHMVMLPFALLIIAAASTATGKPEHLPFAVLAIFILLHGHASFLPFCAVSVVLFGIYLWISVRRGATVVRRRTLVTSAVIAALFALPIVLNTLLHWPGEFPKYLSQSTAEEGRHRSLVAVGKYVAELWLATSPTRVLLALAVIAAAILATVIAQKPLRQFLTGTLVLCGIASLWTLFYAYKGVDNLAHGYLIAYYSVVPCLVLLVAILGFTSLLDGKRWAAVSAAVVGGLFSGWLLVSQPTLVNSWLGSQQIRGAETAIAARIPANQQVVIQFNEDSWIPALGLIEQYRRIGRSACVDGPDSFRVYFTDSEYCTPAQIAAGGKAKLSRYGSARNPNSIPLGEEYYLSFPRIQATAKPDR